MVGSRASLCGEFVIAGCNIRTSVFVAALFPLYVRNVGKDRYQLLRADYRIFYVQVGYCDTEVLEIACVGTCIIRYSYPLCPKIEEISDKIKIFCRICPIYLNIWDFFTIFA